MDSTARLRCLLLFSHHSLLVRGRKAIQKTLVVVVVFYIEVDVQISKKWAFCVHAREPLLSRTALHASSLPSCCVLCLHCALTSRHNFFVAEQKSVYSTAVLCVYVRRPIIYIKYTGGADGPCTLKVGLLLSASSLTQIRPFFC